MSVKYPPDQICFTTPELYLLLQHDRALHQLCDVMEDTWTRIQRASHSRKRLKARAAIMVSLIDGSDRTRMFERVTQVGYSETYAEKLVDETIDEFKK